MATQNDHSIAQVFGNHAMPVVVPFSDTHVQVFGKGMQPAGVFSQVQLATDNKGNVKQLQYVIDYAYTPAKGKKPATMQMKLTATVTDIETKPCTTPAGTKGER